MEFDLVKSLVRVVELKDESTAAHTYRVALYTQALGEALGYEQDIIRRLMHAAVVHDIGKVEIPTQILTKAGPLTDEEFEVIKSHTTRGYDLLRQIGVDDPLVLDLVRHHHERMDGSGYPDGLAGEAIPEAARFFAVIDTFDAMTSLRPYRRKTGREAADRAMAELRRLRGVWYCPSCVDAFADLYDRGMLEWIMHHVNDEESLGEVEVTADPQVILDAMHRLVSRSRQTPQP